LGRADTVKWSHGLQIDRVLLQNVPSATLSSFEVGHHDVVEDATHAANWDS